jgi:peptidoglycan/LPS O-acetylase OafA/YrhL
VIFFLSACSLWIKNGALPDLWPELLLISNYVPGVIVPGSWSLATEEQFYLTVPTLILILSFFTSSIKNLRWIFYGIFLIAPVVRFLVWQQVDVSGSSEHSAITQHIYFPFHTHMDGLIMGMILSNLLTDTQLRAHRFLKYPLLFLPVAVVIAFFLKKSNGIIFEYTGLALIFGSLVWICLRSQNNFLIRFLSWRGFYTVSKLSYGMYLLHQFCLPVALNVGLVRLDGMSLTVQFTAAFLVNVVASMGLAILGTVLIEHPFLRLRSRLGISS